MTEPNGATPASVQPQPSPVQWVILPAQGPAGPMVVVQLNTILGQLLFFLTPADAKGIAAQLESIAGTAQTGLILPRGATT